MDLSDTRAGALKESYQGLEKKITERTRDLSALYASLAPLVSSDPVQLLQQIVERLKEATGADAALIRILDKKTNQFLDTANLGFPAEFLQATQHLDDASAVSASFVSGQPIIAPDIATDARLKNKRQLADGFRSCAFLPFKVSGEIRGILHLASRETGHFSADRTDHLMAIARQMGVALENRELFEQTTRLAGEIEARYRELQVLHEIGQAILASPDIHSTLASALEKALSVARLDIGHIRLFDSGGRMERGVYSGYRVVGEAQRHVHGNVAGGGPFSSQVIASRKGLVVEDIATVEGMSTFKREGVRSAVIVPIVTEKEVLGVVEVGSRGPRKFSPEDVRLLEAIGNQIGIAVQKGRLFEEMQRRAQEQEAISAVAMAASRSPDLREMLGNALDKVLEVTGRERASIRLRHPVTGEVTLSAERGFQPDEVEARAQRTVHPLIADVFATGKPLVVDDGASMSGAGTLLPHSRSVAWIPIKSRQRVLGVLAISAGKPVPFAPREVEFLEAIGNVIGIATENARLYENERTQVQSLRILVDASQKLVERSDIDTLAQDILDTVVTSFGVRLAWIGRAEPDGLVKPLYWAGDVADYLRDVEIRWDDSPLGQGPAGRAIRTGLPVVMDVATDPGFAPWSKPALAHGYREVAAFPLMRGAKPFGHLILYSGETGYFTAELVELLQTYANIATAALEGARLFEETRRQGQEKAALNTVATALSQSLEVDEILNIAIDKVLEVTGRERGYILLKDPVTGEIVLPVHRGISEAYVEKLLLRRAVSGKTDRLFDSGAPAIYNDPDKAPLNEEVPSEGRRVMASIPLKAQGKVVGLLNLSSVRLVPFSDREVELLQSIGNVIGVALENAWLYQESRQQREIQTLLKELSQDITGPGFERLLAKIADKVRGVFQVDIADFRLLEEGVVKFMGLSGEWARNLISSDKMRGRIKWVLEHRAPLMIPDATVKDAPPGGDLIARLGIRGYLAVPLFSRGGAVIGVLRALTYRPREFKQKQIDALQQLANGAGIALENAFLFEETEKRAQEQAALSAIATATSQSLRLDEMLRLALDKVLEVTGREKGYIRLKDPLTGEVKLAAYRGISDEYAATLLRPKTPGGKNDQVFATGEPLIINEAEGAELNQESRRDGSRSMAWIPLKSQGKVVGILNVSTARPVSFTASEENLLQAIGNVIGVAVENAWLFEESQRQEQVQKLLKEMSQDITKLDIDTLFQKVTDKVREFFRTDIADIRLLEEGGVRRVGSSGIDSELLYQMGGIQGRTKWIVNNRRALVIGDTTQDESISTGRAIRELGIRGYVGVPLFSRGGEVMGILRALTYEPREFSPSEVDLLQQLANGTAIALTNARLFEETERSAHEQSVLNAIAVSMSQSLRVDELLNIALNKVLEVTGRIRGSIKLKEHATGRIVLAAHQGLSEEYVNTIRAHFSPEEKAAEIFESGEVVIVDDPEKKLFNLSEREEGLRSLIWVPLKGRGTVIGILNVSTPQSNPFTPREIDLLKSVGSVIGIAVENARLFEETESRARELAALHAVTAAVSSSFDLEHILLKGLDAVLEVTEMEGGYIHFLEGTPPKLMLKAYRGMSEAYIARVGGGSRPGGKAERMIATKQPVVLENIPLDYAGKFKGEKITSAAWVPIIAKDKVAGILAVCSRTKKNFAQAQLPLLLSIGNALGVAVENTGLFQETKRSLERIRALREIDQAISSTLDLGNVLDVLLEKIDLSLPYASATIRLLNKQSGNLEPVACRNLDEKEWKLEQWKTGRGIANVVMETKAPLIISDVRKDARVLDIEFYRKHRLASYVGVPLIVKDEALGVLGFYTKEEHEFTGEEVEFLSTLAGQAAIAIHNSQLYENARLRETQLQETNRMLSGLHAVAAAASQSLDIDRVLQAAIDKIRQIFGFDATQIHIYDGHTDELHLRACFEIDPNRFATVQSFRRGQGIVGKVAESGKPLIFEDIATDRLYRQLSRSKVSGESGYHFFSVFPIRGKLKNLGTLACTGTAPRSLSAGEIQLLEAMADQIAVALENSELYGELRQKVEELERANKVKDEFLSVMSHELRTPLNVVIGYAGLIREGMLGETNPEQNKALDKLVSRTSDLLGMITSILYATSIEANEVRVETGSFPLGDLLDEVKRPYALPLSKPVEIDWSYAPDLPVMTSDREKVKSILQNLVNNAAKFTEKGRIEVSVRLTETLKHKMPGSRRDGAAWPAADRPPTKRQWVEIRVADTGVGIAEEKLSFIFDKFRQGDSSETRQYGGVGLGLYISRSFAEMLGGKIEVETEPGKGSVFTVRIPLMDPAAPLARLGAAPAAIGSVPQLH